MARLEMMDATIVIYHGTLFYHSHHHHCLQNLRLLFPLCHDLEFIGTSLTTTEVEMTDNRIDIVFSLRLETAMVKSTDATYHHQVSYPISWISSSRSEVIIDGLQIGDLPRITGRDLRIEKAIRTCEWTFGLMGGQRVVITEVIKDAHQRDLGLMLIAIVIVIVIVTVSNEIHNCHRFKHNHLKISLRQIYALLLVLPIQSMVDLTRTIQIIMAG